MSRLVPILAALSALIVAACTTPPPLVTDPADVGADDALIVFRSIGHGKSGKVGLFRPDPETYWDRVGVPPEQNHTFSNKTVGSAYGVFKVPAGTYELGYTEWQGAAVIYRYHSTQTRFTVEPGEVVYIGDLNFREAFNTFLVEVTDARAAAAAYLAETFPDLQDTMVTRLATVGRKVPDPTSNKYCYGIWPMALSPNRPCQ
jgi:hypothetical protein